MYLNKGRASAAVSGAPSRELTGKQLAQTRLGHPSVRFGDWRKFYDTVRVVRAADLGGRKIYVVRLESAMWVPEAGAIPTTTTYSDYREVGGMRVPHRSIESTEVGGRMIFEAERVEIGVALAPGTFTLQPSTESDRKK